MSLVELHWRNILLIYDSLGTIDAKKNPSWSKRMKISNNKKSIKRKNHFKGEVNRKIEVNLKKSSLKRTLLY